MNAERTTRSLERLSELTTYVDRLSAKHPLRDHPSLRAQMRRSAIDSLTHTACAAEALSPADCRRLYLRALGALTELETFTRMASRAGAITPREQAEIELLVGHTNHTVRLCLDVAGDALETPVLPDDTTEPAVPLFGAA